MWCGVCGRWHGGCRAVFPGLVVASGGVGIGLDVLKESFAESCEVDGVLIGDVVHRSFPGPGWSGRGDAQQLVDLSWMLPSCPPASASDPRRRMSGSCAKRDDLARARPTRSVERSGSLTMTDGSSSFMPTPRPLSTRTSATSLTPGDPWSCLSHRPGTAPRS